MKTEFAVAITQLAAERSLPKEVILSALEAALVSAYKKQAPLSEEDISVRIDPNADGVKFYIQKLVVESVDNPHREIAVAEARNLKNTAQVGDTVEVEFVPRDGGRIAAQAARQIVLQRLREAEHHATYEEFASKEGEIVSGVVQFVDPTQIYIRLNRVEAILPASEQVVNEHYHKGRRLKLYLLEITRRAMEPKIIVSRSHPNLLRRLLEQEIPELHSGIIEIKGVAREAGYRSKVAVAARQEGVEPVGCCLGSRGIRLQGIINELNGEKIDVILWHDDPKVFISNALGPAQIASIELGETEKVASVIVPDKQLSLAIGKEGQNARLAARLTGWRIDIKSVSTAEVERVALAEAKMEAKAEEEVEMEAEAEIVGKEVEGVAEGDELIPIGSDEIQMSESVSEIEVEEPAPFPIEDEFILVSEAPPEESEGKKIRFAEDILPSITKANKQGKGGKSEKSKVKGKRVKKQLDYVGDDVYEE